MRRPIYAGADRALVRLASGEHICVDTNSLDAIDYLLGWDMEADVLPLFRSFLQPKSVVLDIGANFGLYTAISASRMRDHGRLYSFEANPHTFDLLKRTSGRVWTIGRRPLRQLLRRRRQCLGGGRLQILEGGLDRPRMHRPEVVDNLPLACVNKAGDIRRQFDYAPEIDTVIDPLNGYANRLQTPQDILNWLVKSRLVQVYSPPRVKNGKGRRGLGIGQRGSR